VVVVGRLVVENIGRVTVVR